ncbi:MAG: zinc-ribbon domain-containing protein [Proteobacteria bacterium]|nr:zinc-ribbon domain-containing protein [Pseudomonadota bacterium]
MIVECSNCHSTFKLADDLVPPEGRKVKCSVCDNVFSVRPEGDDEPEEAFAAASGDAKGDLSDDDLDSALDAAFSDDDEDDAADDDGPSRGAGDRFGFDLDSIPKKMKIGGKGKKIGIIVAVVLLVFALAGLGLYFLAPGLIGMAPEEQQVQGEDPLAMAEQVKNIYLDGIRQYYVDNDKTGRIFVVEGKAVNQFDKAKELIEVEANLYDTANTVLDTVRLKCGNTLSLFQLQVLSREEIEAALADEAGIGANNVNLATGQQVPFMIVFFDPADTVAEFNVSVVTAQDVNL